MNRFKDKRIAGLFAFIAVLAVMFAGAFCILTDQDSSDAATGSDLSSQYGSPTVISMAQGFKLTYNIQVNEDLVSGTTVSFQVNELGSTAAKIEAKTSTTDKTQVAVLTVAISSSVAAGSYNIVLLASHSPSGQNAYQYIKINVTAGLTLTATGTAQIIKGSSQTVSFSSSGGQGTTTWSPTSTPAGMTWDATDHKFTGTPTALGKNTATVSVTNNGQTISKSYEFTVYSKIVNGSAATLTSINGASKTTSAITNGSDIGVEWTMPTTTGASVNKSTGIVTFANSTYLNTSVTVTGTSTAGPSQTVTWKVTLHSEPTLTLSQPGDILTYINNSASKSTTSVSNAVSKITYSVSGGSGATIDSSGNAGSAQTATVTVKSPTTAGMSQTVTITAVSEFGQTDSITFTEKVEAALSVTAATPVYGYVGSPAKSTVTMSGGSGNSITAVSSSNTNISASYSGTEVSASASSHQAGTITVTVKSAAGQTATCQISAEIYTVLTFLSAPSASAVVYGS